MGQARRDRREMVRNIILTILTAFTVSGMIVIYGCGLPISESAKIGKVVEAPDGWSEMDCHDVSGCACCF